MALDREVGGIRCFQVLESLSAYLDNELEAPTRSRVELHLSGCDVCAKFGSEMGNIVRGLQTQLQGSGQLEANARRRLKEALDRELGVSHDQDPSG